MILKIHWASFLFNYKFDLEKLDHGFDYVNLNLLLVFLLCPHGDLQLLHVYHCF